MSGIRQQEDLLEEVEKRVENMGGSWIDKKFKPGSGIRFSHSSLVLDRMGEPSDIQGKSATQASG